MKKQRLDEASARRIAEQKLSGTDLVLSRGVVFHDHSGWRFAARPATAPDVAFTGQEMTVMVWVRPDDELC